MEGMAAARPQRDAAHEDMGSRLGTARVSWKRMWQRGKAHLDQASEMPRAIVLGELRTRSS